MKMKFALLARLLGLAPVFALPTYAQVEAPDSQMNSVEAWKKRVSIQLASKRIYPRNAPAEGGAAKVLFVLDRTGKLISHALVESTGSRELDIAALATVEAVAPFPEPPAQLEDDMLHFTVPFVFKARTTFPSTNAAPPAEALADQAKVNAKMHSICRGC